jgi:hypothetical protein
MTHRITHGSSFTQSQGHTQSRFITLQKQLLSRNSMCCIVKFLLAQARHKRCRMDTSVSCGPFARTVDSNFLFLSAHCLQVRQRQPYTSVCSGRVFCTNYSALQATLLTLLTSRQSLAQALVERVHCEHFLRPMKLQLLEMKLAVGLLCYRHLLQGTIIPSVLPPT